MLQSRGIAVSLAERMRLFHTDNTKYLLELYDDKTGKLLKNVNNEGWKPYKLYDENNPTYFNNGHISWDYFLLHDGLKRNLTYKIFSYGDQEFTKSETSH